LNREFSKEEVQMANKYNSPGHKRNTNKNYTKISCHPDGMAIIKNIYNNKCWQGCSKTEFLLLVGM
jgi:hypothetical protein